jgi:hypothetical protein
MITNQVVTTLPHVHLGRFIEEHQMKVKISNDHQSPHAIWHLS